MSFVGLDREVLDQKCCNLAIEFVRASHAIERFGKAVEDLGLVDIGDASEAVLAGDPRIAAQQYARFDLIRCIAGGAADLVDEGADR